MIDFSEKNFNEMVCVQEQFDYYNLWQLENCINEVLVQFGFDFNVVLLLFFGGWLCKVVLGWVLVSNLCVLLLDELINYLDIEIIDWLEGFLKIFNGMIIFIFYDCLFICNMVICIVDFDCGKLVIYLGNYD